jgi:hypothetical protein
MRHDWVFDVLSDLLAYALQNELPRLAARVTEAIAEARQEIASVEAPDDPSQPQPPPNQRVH